MIQLKKLLSLSVIVLLLNCCGKKQDNENIRSNYDPLFAALPKINAEHISLEYSNIDGQHKIMWSAAQILDNITDEFYTKYLSEYDQIKLWAGYQDLSGGIIALGKGNKSLILLQEVRNGDIANIFLIPVQPDGLADTLFRAATMEKSPDDLLLEESHLDTVNNQIRKIRLFSFVENDVVAKDSLTYLYDIKNSGFTLIKKDSIRIME